MKVDGKEIAKANLARRAENQKQGDDAGKDIKAEILERGDHIAQMFSMIEAIHAKDPEAAHKYMVAYAESATKKKPVS